MSTDFKAMAPYVTLDWLLLDGKRRREASFDLLYVENIDKFELGNS